MKVTCVCFLLCLLLCLSATAQKLTEYVNPFIGTSNYGATHPGPVMPNGMVSVVPFNVAHKKGQGNVFEKDSEWHSRPYVFENSFLTGYSHVNLSGVGCPELGSVILMPTTGALEFDAEKYGSTYSNEEASPGYYSHRLYRYDTEVELTATLRTGLSRYHFPAGQANILLNLGLGLTNETGGALKIVSDTEIEGYKMIGTFCYNPEDVRPVYFAVKVSKGADKLGAWKKMPSYQGVEADWISYNDAYKPYPGYRQEMAGDDIGAYLSYDLDRPETIEVKVGISYVSTENAWLNLNLEQPGFDFDETRRSTEDAWNDLLKRIQVEGGSQEDKTIFYSALYHLLMHPNILQDINGDYPLMGRHGRGNTGGRNRYTVYSLWDTYRNVHPFLSLVYPELQEEMLQTMVEMYKESGWLPKWELLGMETAVMVGDPATPVIADSYLRGIRNFDVDAAYNAARKAAVTTEQNPLRPGIALYERLGWIPEFSKDSIWGTVSTSLEYNISDWNLSQLAKALGKEDDYRRFGERSLSYRNYFDDSTGMLRPRVPDGSWLEPFDPEAGKNFEPVIGFVEGNAWQYRFYVPHDIDGLIGLLGGEERFIEELQLCFDSDNYDMANEPDITYPYLFNYVQGEEWRTQKTVRELIGKYYANTPAGIPGNDDTGTLSAWLLFSMMGLYPDCPGNMFYTLTSPIFDRVVIYLNKDYYPGDFLAISTVNNGPENFIIDRINWKGKRLKNYFVDHHQLVKGGELQFVLEK